MTETRCSRLHPSTVSEILEGFEFYSWQTEKCLLKRLMITQFVSKLSISLMFTCVKIIGLLNLEVLSFFKFFFRLKTVFHLSWIYERGFSVSLRSRLDYYIIGSSPYIRNTCLDLKHLTFYVISLKIFLTSSNNKIFSRFTPLTLLVFLVSLTGVDKLRTSRC